MSQPVKPERISYLEFRQRLKPTLAKASKYKNIRTVGADGVTYASGLEARHAEALDAQKRAGLIRGWTAQVSIRVPGTSRRMIVDFMVVRNDGTVALQDTKGFVTKDWALKRELVEKALGVPIEIVRRGRQR